MGAMQRHRLKRELEGMDLSILGDSETTSMATGAASELLSMAGKLAAESQKKKEEAAKTKADKDAYDAAHKDQTAAEAVAKEARKQAALAAAEAQGEKDPNGPKHKKAEAAESNARVAEAKAAYYSTGGTTMPDAGGMARGGHAAPSSGGVPTWAWVAGGAVGVGLLGLVTYKMLKR